MNKFLELKQEIKALEKLKTKLEKVEVAFPKLDDELYELKREKNLLRYDIVEMINKYKTTENERNLDIWMDLCVLETPMRDVTYKYQLSRRQIIKIKNKMQEEFDEIVELKGLVNLEKEDKPNIFRFTRTEIDVYDAIYSRDMTIFQASCYLNYSESYIKKVHKNIKRKLDIIKEENGGVGILTEEEYKIAKMLKVERMTSHEIAERLCKSERTIRRIKKRIVSKVELDKLFGEEVRK